MWRPDNQSNTLALHCMLTTKEKGACSQCTKMCNSCLQQTQLSPCAYVHAECMKPYMHHMIPTHTNHLTGTLPEAWADPGSFPALTSLTLDLSNLSGILPPAWGNNGSFPVFDSLSLGPFLSSGVAPLAGPLPKAWSSPTAFPMLTSLSITNLSITGRLLQAAKLQ